MSDNKPTAAEPTDVAETPDVTGLDGLRKIKPLDLALHSDGIDHWQDEPQDKAQSQSGTDAAIRNKDGDEPEQP